MPGDPPKAPSPYVGVIGASEASDRDRETGQAVGEALARAGAIVVCGGRGGVMEAACLGARAGGGLTVGILPGGDRSAANDYLDVALPTGLGELRNGLVVRCSDSLVAVGGSWGTLSEIAFAMRTGRSVVALGSWEELPSETAAPGPATAELAAAEPRLAHATGRLIRATDPEQAVDHALRLAADWAAARA